MTRPSAALILALAVAAGTAIQGRPAGAEEAAASPADPVKPLVARLDLERYKGTIKASTRFGDRRQGTDRNRAAADWIEAQLKRLIPAISVRENERGREIGAGWDPQWHQPTDLYAAYSDADFRLGLNAAQTTLGAVARLCGAMTY